MNTPRVACSLVSTLFVGVVLAGCSPAKVTTRTSGTSTPTGMTPGTPSPTSPPASPIASPGTTSGANAPTLTVTGRDVGFRFTTTEGEVSGPNGLKALDSKCVKVTSAGCVTIAEYVQDQQGPMIWVAQGGPLPSSLVMVTHSYVPPPLASGEQLHFAENSGLVAAIVQGSSDSTFHWPDIVAAWSIDPGTGAVASVPATGVSVLDACGQERAQPGKVLPWCT